jgi:hypothetical protein
MTGYKTRYTSMGGIHTRHVYIPILIVEALQVGLFVLTGSHDREPAASLLLPATCVILLSSHPNTHVFFPASMEYCFHKMLLKGRFLAVRIRGWAICIYFFVMDMYFLIFS